MAMAMAMGMGMEMEMEMEMRSLNPGADRAHGPTAHVAPVRTHH